jgi:Crinkler effector protein N-terminal domain
MPDTDPLSINCWIMGDDYRRVFPVKISSNEVVGHLKDAIKVNKHPSLNDIDASTLILYKVSIECTPQLAERVAALELNEELLPLDELSEVFANGLLRKHLHVVVKTPSGAWVYVGLSSLR